MAKPERVARRIAAASLVSSATLCALKIAVGLAAHSVALVSDGIESGTDILAAGLLMLGLWVAAKPADSDHPYGHGRFEILAGLGIGVLLAVIGTGISLSSLQGRADQHVPASFAIWPLLLSIGVKSGFASAKFRLGRRTGSSSLRADAWHDLLDILSGVLALAGVGLAILSPNLHAADHYGGFAVGVVVIFVGLRVARETVWQLSDVMPGSAEMDQVRESALRVPGARGVEKCFARKTGMRYHVDLHLEVDPEMTVRESHEIAQAVRERIKADISWVEDVLVHVEPYGELGNASGRNAGRDKAAAKR